MAVDESGDSRRRPLRLQRGGLKAEGSFITRLGGGDSIQSIFKEQQMKEVIGEIVLVTNM